MAKVTGPLFSLSASGTFKKTLTYGMTHHLLWLRLWQRIRNNKSIPQQERQTIFKEAISKWDRLDVIQKKAWSRVPRAKFNLWHEIKDVVGMLGGIPPSGPEQEISPRCAFVKTYLLNKGPWANYPWVPKKDPSFFYDIWGVGGYIYEDNVFCWYYCGTAWDKWLDPKVRKSAGAYIYQANTKEEPMEDWDFVAYLTYVKEEFIWPQPRKAVLIMIVADIWGAGSWPIYLSDYF